MMRFAAIAAALVAALLCCVIVLTSAAAAAAVPKKYELTFYLNRVNSERKLQEDFLERSTPGTSLFRKWLSPAQITELYRAPADVIDAATALLQQDVGCSAVELSAAKDMLHCVIDEAKAPRMHAALSARFSQLPAASPSVTVESFSELRSLMRLCRTIVAYRPLTSEMVRASTKQQKLTGEPGMKQTPHSINSRYRVADASTLHLDTALSVGVAEFEGSYYEKSDLSSFSKKFLGREIRTLNLGPWEKPGLAGAIEGTLDLEYISSVNNGTLPVYWLAQAMQQGSEPGGINFAKLFDQIAALPEKEMPSVVSISWGLAEYFYAEAKSDMTEASSAFRKAGLRGISVFAASGDSGPGSRRQHTCQKFDPAFPASAPTLTTVGATFANSESTPEIAVPFSGGGFSDQFEMQQWQRSHVEKYLREEKGRLPAAHFFNRSGRAYPDVGALGTNFEIAVQGRFMEVSGTSCASPTFAGVIGLMAAERKASGKPLFGFLNPALYKAGDVGYDVVEGASVDKNCNPFKPEKGFAAARGWDPVSGLGTPRMPQLKKILGE